ncbi:MULTISPECIES: alpha/beta fold hydrolase [unclassified Gilliamella]|uniref:alpha/beta fold hydrolase n=1 Tax=unclassified Gilliamella TaxID=2685620 RepID=UPI002269BA15|nr:MULTISPECIES: alpha/beta fold hydrolase [unclassified Gilliamella]MCX8597130.1 alpha/beta fold hydrolase [Gilliamella sp. B3493]MCX8598764.1 alpha/beta fold hydrolase [Gilliamella sp. B3486]MCX8689228.1 alpha/beta fold hydrolase [Gilliamella sp. B2973]MCX8704930.1 alpha/beta fold hydrolase [Gilliamella sp. B3127]
MKLNYKIQGDNQPVLLMHGLFGSLDNLNMLAKDLSSHYQTIQVDLRNHGQSPWSNVMNYEVMAEDVAELCHDLQLQNIILIGHSMGGKVAMQLSQLIPVSKICVIDIAPVKYNQTANAPVLNALEKCINQQLTDKKQIIELMHDLSASTISFLLKSFKHQHWLFNAQVIINQYDNICDWQTISPCNVPTLFIRGGNSNYITDKDYPAIFSQFPNAQIEIVEGAGHNVHAEKTQQVLQLLHTNIKSFI